MDRALGWGWGLDWRWDWPMQPAGAGVTAAGAHPQPATGAGRPVPAGWPPCLVALLLVVKLTDADKYWLTGSWRSPTLRPLLGAEDNRVSEKVNAWPIVSD